jgi:hypothetical protein
MRLFFFPIICFFILGHRTLSSPSTPSWEATSKWPPPPPCIATAHTHHTSDAHAPRERTAAAAVPHSRRPGLLPAALGTTGESQAALRRGSCDVWATKWHCREEAATLRRFLAKRPCRRGSTAWRSPTMAAAELLAAVECVCPLPNPCAQASKEERKAEGTIAQFTL